MQKRDRFVQVFQHRRSKDVLFFPLVCYMAGEGMHFGDAAVLRGPVDPEVLAKQVARLLRACKKADIEAMRERRMAQLRCYWKGINGPSGAKATPGPTYSRLLVMFPALAKGPGAYLRQFAACEIFERDGWKYRKVVRQVKSEHRGCTTEGETLRIPVNAKPRHFGEIVLEFLSK